jgi:hypothetical protein
MTSSHQISNTNTHARTCALAHTRMHTNAHVHKTPKKNQARVTLETDGVQSAMLAMRFRSMRRCASVKIQTSRLKTENLLGVGQLHARERVEPVLEEISHCSSAETAAPPPSQRALGLKKLHNSHILNAHKVSQNPLSYL